MLAIFLFCRYLGHGAPARGTGSWFKGAVMSQECIFCKIVRGEIPSAKVYEDDDFLVFKDINPAAPVHLLAIPKRHIARLSQAQQQDADFLGRFMLMIGDAAREQSLDSFRLIINDGEGAGQTVFHLHAHILGGGRFGEKLL